MARRPPSVCLSVCLSVRPSVNFCANRLFSQTNGRIATKLSQDGLQVSVHPRCAQGQDQGQRSRDTRTVLDSWNESVIDGLVVALDDDADDDDDDDDNEDEYWTEIYLLNSMTCCCSISKQLCFRTSL